MQNYPNEKQAVENLQRYLRRLSFHDSDIPQIAIDGIFGKETEDALRAFQAKYGIEPTGRADLYTWNLLYDIFSREELATSPPNMIDPFPRFPNDYSIGKGEPIGEGVALLTYIIQIMLLELSSLYDEILEGGIENPPYPNGIFDDKTENAVKSFQKINGLEMSGRVDKPTWNTLVAVYNKHNFSGNQ